MTTAEQQAEHQIRTPKKTQKAFKQKPKKANPMITPERKADLEKQQYRIVGNHSVVKVCSWTKLILVIFIIILILAGLTFTSKEKCEKMEVEKDSVNFKYDDNNKIIEKTIEFYKEGKLMSQDNYTYEYDDKGNIMTITLKSKGPQTTLAKKKIYRFYYNQTEKGLIRETMKSYFENGSFVGKEERLIRQIYSDLKPNETMMPKHFIEKINRYLVYFEDHIYELVKENKKENLRKSWLVRTKYHDNLPVKIVIENNDPSFYLDQIKITYAHEKGRVIERIEQKDFNHQNKNKKTKRIQRFKYDEEGDIIRFTEQSYIRGKLHSNRTYKYDKQNNQIEDDIYIHEKDSPVAYRKTSKYLFDNEGRLIEKRMNEYDIYLEKNKTELANNEIEKYYLNDAGELTKSEFEKGTWNKKYTGLDVIEKKDEKGRLKEKIRINWKLTCN
ncbi:hypothetical protein DRJ22_03400 [Candidatus Woesearchaeota archaeon]|nr:MAG: hypothetical protein DRJ22_03400 [Candidatus Woesearchaeota archaeon]